MFLTFLLSAAVHELVMAVVTKKIRMYLFTMQVRASHLVHLHLNRFVNFSGCWLIPLVRFVLQLCQIPLIAFGNMPVIKKNKLLGNVVFWVGLYAGFPLLCVAYCAY